jgi:hypothetical protein
MSRAKSGARDASVFADGTPGLGEFTASAPNASDHARFASETMAAKITNHREGRDLSAIFLWDTHVIGGFTGFEPWLTSGFKKRSQTLNSQAEFPDTLKTLVIKQKLVAAKHAPVKIFNRFTAQPHRLGGDLANPHLDAFQQAPACRGIFDRLGCCNFLS